MTDKENNPDQYGPSDISAMQCQDDWAVPPPEFHCPVCDGTGSLMPHDEWKPEVCWSCNGKD